jgi:hypothetical protein
MVIRRWGRSRIAVLAACFAAVACDSPGGDPAEPGSARRQAARSPEAPDPTTPGLCDVRLVPGGSFLVTPRWSPAGDRLLASGRWGVGLFLVDGATLSVVTLDPSARGDAVWTPDGLRVLQAAPGVDGALLERDLASPGERLVARPAFLPRPERLAGAAEGATAVVLHESGDLRVVYEEHRGRLVVLRGDGETVLAAEDAWHARVSSDGRRVAWSVGHLAQAELFVADVGGATRRAGPGVHPAWLPDGARLVYALPEAAGGPRGIPELAGAELYVFDARDGSARPLTATAGATEMQPAVTADGARVAYADWRSGALRLARLADPLAGCGGAP